MVWLERKYQCKGIATYDRGFFKSTTLETTLIRNCSTSKSVISDLSIYAFLSVIVVILTS